MIANTPGRPEPTRILGTLHAADGIGIVRLEDQLDARIDDVWSALTDPARLSHWLGTIEGEFRRGGTLHARYHASGWEGDMEVVACERPQRLLLRSTSPDEPEGGTVDVALTVNGAQTAIVIEDRGVPLEHIAAYGAGNQIHLEDLTAYLAGRDRCDAQARWNELEPLYQALWNELPQK